MAIKNSKRHHNIPLVSSLTGATNILVRVDGLGEDEAGLYQRTEDGSYIKINNG